MRKIATLPLAAVLAASGLLFGCATDELKREIAEARSLAEQAQETADRAQKAANESNAKADRAMNAARNAQACCDANSERVDRMFRKAMMK